MASLAELLKFMNGTRQSLSRPLRPTNIGFQFA